METRNTPDHAVNARGRWSARGLIATAAVMAIAVVTGGVSVSQATPASTAESVYVAIEPCRLLDSRGASNVGDFSGRIGAGVSWDLSTHGVNGECNLPADAVALSVNITGLRATESTYLTLWPTGAEVPTASNLNLSPGAPPVANSASVALSATGQFSLYNDAGAPHVIIDVAGYFVDAGRQHHDAVAAPVAEGFETDEDLFFGLVPSQPITALFVGQPVGEVEIETDGPGTVIATSSVQAFSNYENGYVACAITNGAVEVVDADDVDDVAVREWVAAPSAPLAAISSTRTFRVESASTFNVVLRCEGAGIVGFGITMPFPDPVLIGVRNRSLTALFVPDAPSPN